MNIPPKGFLMAEKQPDSHHSPENRPVLVSSGSSSTLSTAAASDLQPFSLGRVSSSVTSPSNLSSYTVPVRLDVLYFLLNSAAKAQNALPSIPVCGGQGTFSTCPCSSAQHAVSCSTFCHHSTCGGAPSCSSGQQLPSGGAHHHLGQLQGGYPGQGGFSTGVPGSQNTGYTWLKATHQSDGQSWPGSGWPGSSQPGSSQPNSAATGTSSQATAGWKGHQREEGAGRNNRGNWQGKWSNKGRSWGDRRQGGSESSFRKPGSQNWGREGSSFGSNADSGRRNQEGNRRKMPWDVPEAKRHSDDGRVGWQKNQGKLEPTNPLSKAVGAGPAKPAVPQGGGEDWETDYESEQASSAAQAVVCYPAFQKSQGDTPKTSEDWENECASFSSPPKSRPSIFPLLGLPSKDPRTCATRKESSGSHEDQSKNGGFVSYLKSLHSDPPGKSSSEGSTELVIDTDIESSKLSEVEQSPKNAAGEESKAWE
ncbi:uncharacterized protein LOC121915977 isoform X2 [Sceloporus undulatus]|nr:uncharacterized protein LOC121915977 isoform X2 [Sceloporus undulatus]